MAHYHQIYDWFKSKATSRHEQAHVLTYGLPQPLENPSKFHRFLEFPQELRAIVYEFYFEHVYLVSRHQRVGYQHIGLLSASRQLYQESVEVMYKKATLMVSFEKKHAPPGARD
jgi:hypothetical protein